MAMRLALIAIALAAMSTPTTAQESRWADARAAYDMGIERGRQVRAEREMSGEDAAMCAGFWSVWEGIVERYTFSAADRAMLGEDLIDYAHSSSAIWTTTALASGATKSQIDEFHRQASSRQTSMVLGNKEAEKEFFLILGVCRIEN